MKGNEKLCAKMTKTFLRKWWIVAAVSTLIILFGVIVVIFFMSWVNLFVDHEITLRNGSKTFSLWSKPPVTPLMKIYVYNVTNAEEFLNNGSKPILDELGPYVYRETWEKKNLAFNDNDTVTFQQQKIYMFDEELSGGLESDMVVVPNIPMLSATSQSKHAARFLRLAMASIMEALKIKPFVEVSVGQLLWGYEDPLLQLAKDVVTADTKLPYDEFGLFYKKNGTSEDVVTVFTGAGNISNYGIIDKYNGRSHMTHWTTDECNSLHGSDGSIFPPHITRNTTLYLYDKDLCRLFPMTYKKDIVTDAGVPGFRFGPPESIFASVDRHPDNMCFCPHGPPCAPNGLFNVSLCQLDSPVMLSFPHFYLADSSLRDAVEGVSEPDPDKHAMYLDVQPLMGTTLSAKARVQINLAVSQVIDIKQVATFPDIVFPIIWFEDGINSLPADVTDLMRLAVNVPPIAHVVLSALLFVVGALMLVVALWRIIKGATSRNTLHLAAGHN